MKQCTHPPISVKKGSVFLCNQIEQKLYLLTNARGSRGRGWPPSGAKKFVLHVINSDDITHQWQNRVKHLSFIPQGGVFYVQVSWGGVFIQNLMMCFLNGFLILALFVHHLESCLEVLQIAWYHCRYMDLFPNW
jgi:hypothetical protein